MWCCCWCLMCSSSGGDDDGEAEAGDKITPACVLRSDDDEDEWDDACRCLTDSLLVQLCVAVCLSECWYECILAVYLPLPSPPISFTPFPLLFGHSHSLPFLCFPFPFLTFRLIPSFPFPSHSVFPSHPFIISFFVSFHLLV